MYVNVFLAPYVGNNIGNKSLNTWNNLKYYKFGSMYIVSLAGPYTALQMFIFVKACVIFNWQAIAKSTRCIAQRIR